MNILSRSKMKRCLYAIFRLLKEFYERLPLPYRFRAAIHFRLFAPFSRLVGLSRLKPDVVSYQDWIRHNEPDAKILQIQREHRFPNRPLISIVVPMHNAPLVFFEELINSVLAQTYDHWELCLADGSAERNIEAEKLCASDKRIRYCFLKADKRISDNTNEAIRMASGDYIAFMDHDDTLAPFALYENVKIINERPEVEVIFSDEDRLVDGRRSAPVFKPDFAPDTLRSENYMSHLVVMKKALVKQLGGLDAAYEGMQDYDLVLRASEATKNIQHVRKILYHRRQHGTNPGISRSTEAVYAAGIAAIQAHINRLGMKGTVKRDERTPGVFCATYDVIGIPSVSIIIPNKDHISTLRACVDSIIERTTYKNYEIVIVENNSESGDTFAYYREIEGHPQARVLHYPEKGFNYSKIINFGVKNSTSDYIVQLNNDTEIITPSWLEGMLGFAQRPDVGAVGARLFYPDMRVQHAGVRVCAGGQYPEFAHLIQSHSILNCSAVTGACIMCRRALFKEIGYMDEQFQVAFGDIDFCFGLRHEGLCIVYQHYVELYHNESETRGYDDTPIKQAICRQEAKKFVRKWSNEIPAVDPFAGRGLGAVGGE